MVNIKNKIDKFLDKNILKIILYFILLTPFLDLLTSLSLNVLKLSFNYITIIKILFMFLLLYYVLFVLKGKNNIKKYSIYYYLFVLVYFLLYIINIKINKPSSLFIYEIQNIFRTFYFPINLVSLYNIYKSKKMNIDFKTMNFILVFYILLILIPILTNTGFNSYAYSKEGTIGWFNSTNEIGGIISILLPISLYYIFKNKKYFLFLFATLIILFVIFKMGTKVPVLSIGIIFILWFIRYFIKIMKNKEIKKISLLFVIFVLVVSSLIIVLPKTSFYKNIEIHLTFLKVDEPKDFLNERIIDKFIFSDRISYYTNTKNNFLASNVYEKLVGIGYSENHYNDQESIKLIEMDYYDISFRHGALGFIVFFIPYIYVLKIIYTKTKKMTKIDDELFSLYISLILILSLSLLSGHIIVAPSVSIIVIIILLNILKKLEVIK